MPLILRPLFSCTSRSSSTAASPLDSCFHFCFPSVDILVVFSVLSSRQRRKSFELLPSLESAALGRQAGRHCRYHVLILESRFSCSVLFLYFFTISSIVHNSFFLFSGDGVILFLFSFSFALSAGLIIFSQPITRPPTSRCCRCCCTRTTPYCSNLLNSCW